jgi:hypothetical protein
MKRLKVKVGIFLLLGFLLMIPRSATATPINATVFLNIAQTSPIYNMPASEGDTVLWSFETYNDPFNVMAVGGGVGTVVSSGMTSDSGSVVVIATGNIMFTFVNLGTNSGYIDIAISIKVENSIEGYTYITFFIISFTIMALILIKKKSIKAKLF